jgi:hypothetical protein
VTETTPEIDVKDAYVIGFDPGTSTGIVVWSRLKNEVIVQHTASPTDVFPTTQALLRDMVFMNVAPILVAERFDFSMDTLRKSREGINDAINVLGMLWTFSQQFHLPFHKIGRSDSKHFVKDEALKKHNLWLESRHTRDALRSVLTYLASVDQDFVRNYWVK